VLAAAAGEVAGFQLWRDVLHLLGRQRWPAPRNRQAMSLALLPLTAAGWIESCRHGRGGRRVYWISAAGLAARQAPCPVVAIKGSELSGPAFSGFAKVVPGGEAECADRPVMPAEVAHG
jgi:hypothetical protein